MIRFYVSVLIVISCGVNTVYGQIVNIGEVIVKQGTEFSILSDFNNKETGYLLNDGAMFVYKNYNNDGIIEFNPVNNGIVHFKGNNEQQTLSGSVVSKFKNVTFENNSTQPAFIVSGDLSISGISDFSQGIVKNNEGTAFVFEENASHINTDNESHVDGFVEKNGNENFLFPIGNGGHFRPSEYLVDNATGITLVSRYHLANSNEIHPHLEKEQIINIIDNKEYWIVERNNTPSDVALTLHWNEATTSAEILNGVQNNSVIGIVRWDAEENKWKAYNSVVDADNKIVTAAIDKGGVYTLARVKKATTDDGIVVYNGISPNDDGNNDYVVIEGLNDFPENTLEVYNRWGVKVYETQGYGQKDNFFRGISEGRVTLNKGEKLPTGTYFYVLKYKSQSGENSEKVGYMYIN